MRPQSNIIPFLIKKTSAPAKGKQIYQLHVELEETEPVIYRKLLVRGEIGLDLVHAILQIAMGWTNSHLHKFTIGNEEYSDPELELNEMSFVGDPIVADEAIVQLAEVAQEKGFQFHYDYDFGDSWRHCIIVEEVLPEDPALVGFAQCIEGKRACPPEDCGGSYGYADLLETIADPENDEYESMMEWLGGSFNPEAFDLKKTNTFLRKIKWQNPTIDQLGKLLEQRDRIQPGK